MSIKDRLTLVIAGMIGIWTFQNVQADTAFGNHSETMIGTAAPIGRQTSWKMGDVNVLLPFSHTSKLIASNEQLCSIDGAATDFQMARCQKELRDEEETRVLMAMYSN